MELIDNLSATQIMQELIGTDDLLNSGEDLEDESSGSDSEPSEDDLDREAAELIIPSGEKPKRRTKTRKKATPLPPPLSR
jgi:hypothetical protein